MMSNESNSSGQYGRQNVHVNESTEQIARRTGQSQTWAQEAHAAAMRRQQEEDARRRQNNGGY